MNEGMNAGNNQRRVCVCQHTRVKVARINERERGSQIGDTNRCKEGEIRKKKSNEREGEPEW
jgi:hypothetical protein